MSELKPVPQSNPVSEFGKGAFRRFAAREVFPQPEVIRTRYPLVLMHGFGLIASLRRGGHMHSEAMHLRRHGVLAYAPNVTPYHTIPFRAERWGELVDRVLTETGADKVNLIAHSMGGLDARYLISRLGYHDRVASLLTIAAPHRGSALADIILESPERVQAIMTDAARWVSDATMEGMPADFHRAVCDLSPGYVTEQFNPDVPDRADVRYWSWSAGAGRGTDVSINPVLAPLNLLLYPRQGVNDGFVSKESAVWGECLGTLQADHAQQIGIGRSLGSKFDSLGFFVDQARMLAQEGF
ncbi:MAG: alpha/beta fold hydrolase [Rhodothermales bacterium]|nr:alpha/beta fold hydrolase [Rhodothermales bacterium]MBO6780932.1 alpha/beta fold hydrolase [Rhodothermales bacterium]